MKYPAFERILYELLTNSEEEARFNEGRALTYLKNIFKQELPQDYQESLKYSVRLIDGNELIEMMIEHEIGIKKLNDIALFEINDEFFNNKNSWLS